MYLLSKSSDTKNNKQGEIRFSNDIISFSIFVSLVSQEVFYVSNAVHMCRNKLL